MLQSSSNLAITALGEMTTAEYFPRLPFIKIVAKPDVMCHRHFVTLVSALHAFAVLRSIDGFPLSDNGFFFGIVRAAYIQDVL
jgi:hypothetical protein